MPTPQPVADRRDGLRIDHVVVLGLGEFRRRRAARRSAIDAERSRAAVTPLTPKRTTAVARTRGRVRRRSGRHLAHLVWSGSHNSSSLTEARTSSGPGAGGGNPPAGSPAASNPSGGARRHGHSGLAAAGQPPAAFDRGRPHHLGARPGRLRTGGCEREADQRWHRGDPRTPQNNRGIRLVQVRDRVGSVTGHGSGNLNATDLTVNGSGDIRGTMMIHVTGTEWY